MDGRRARFLDRQDAGDGGADTRRRGLDVPVALMSVARRHSHVAMTEQPRNDRDRHAVHHGMPREHRSKVMKANVTDSGPATDGVPWPGADDAWTFRVAWRRKHEQARSTGLTLDDATSLGIEKNVARAGHAVGECQRVPFDLRPAQGEDFAHAATVSRSSRTMSDCCIAAGRFRTCRSSARFRR